MKLLLLLCALVTAWTQVNCQEADSLRLTGNGATYNAGRLEIYHNGVWGTICDDLFEIADANVACFQLGFGYTGVPLGVGDQYGDGVGQIWLDDVECIGTETTIASCPHRAWGANNCLHSEDIAISCYGDTTPAPTSPPTSATGPYVEVTFDSDLTASFGLTSTCSNDYSDQFRRTLKNEMDTVRLNMGTICPDLTDFILVTAYANFVSDAANAFVGFAVDLGTRGGDSVSNLSTCGGILSAYLANFDNWSQPIWSDIAGCPSLSFVGPSYNERGQQWTCPS